MRNDQKIKGGNKMKTNRNMIFAVLVAAFVLMAAPQAVHAWGTWSGTQVDNTALVSFSAGSVAYTTSDTASFVVDALINIQVTNNGAIAMTVWPNETYRVFAFDVQNAGNSTIDWVVEAFGDGALFVTNVNLWSDDGDGSFDSASDTNLSAVAYTVSSAVVDTAITFFIVADVPASPVTGNTPDVYDLLVTAYSGGSPIGTDNSAAFSATTVENVMADTGGTYATDVDYDGRDSAQATYNLVYADLSLTKSFQVIDSDSPFNAGNHAIPGATVEYTLHVLNSGTGAATGISIQDTTPAGTTWGGNESATLGTITGTDPVVWSINSLAGGSSADLTFEVVITTGP
jgi:uncharacterized repeat protein (TIGR01451 family)